MRLAVVVRTDLGMSAGKTAAQVAHAAVAATVDGGDDDRVVRWLDEGQPIVVLRTDSLDLLEARIDRALDAGVRATPVHDAGRTEVAPSTLTCCAFGPDDDAPVARVAGDLPLL